MRMVAALTRPLTADDLLRLDSEGVRGELIRGELCEEMPGGGDHGNYAGNIIIIIGIFIKPRGLGRVLGNDPGVWLEKDPDTVRAPDVAYYSFARWPPRMSVPGYLEIVPDLAVEVASPNDSRAYVHDKCIMWLSFGVRLAWAVCPSSRSVDVHGADGVATLREGDVLDGGDVLPGFTCAVGDIFQP